MQIKGKDNIIFIRLYKEEEIIKKLEEACIKYKIKSAVILSGIGQVDHVKLGYFKKKGNYCPEEMNRPLEILNISGSIIKQKNKYLAHLHITLGDEDKKTFGGHLFEGKISVTGEIVLLKTNISLSRSEDEKTGLELLSLE